MQLAQAGLSDGATVTVCSRLRGGGGDGGSTGAESRSCYLEMYAERKPDKVILAAIHHAELQKSDRDTLHTAAAVA